MFKIGEFSKLSQVSIRMLRHYDKIDLLVPEKTDKFTGYRYYSSDQIEDLNLILKLKKVGFSLEEKYIRRSGVNYIDNCHYEVYENWQDFISKNEGTFYFLTRYGHKPHTSFDYSNSEENIYFVFGKESTGIPKKILRDDLDKCIRIPTTSDVRALNLSNCVAIATYEVLRQQDYPSLKKTEPHKGEDWLLED